MRQIAVVFTVGYDYDLLPGDRRGLAGLDSLTSLPLRLDSCGEAALEYALRLRDQSAALGEQAEVRAVTPGGELPGGAAQNLFAVGVADLVTLGLGPEAAFTPRRTAEAAAEALADQSWDLVLTGWQDSAACGGGLGVCLARRLGMPFAGPLSDLWLEGAALRLCRTLPGGVQQARLRGPAVCAMGNAEHPYLRLATLRDKLKAAGRSPRAFQSTPFRGPEAALAGLRPRDRGRSLAWLEGRDAGEKAQALLAAVFDGKGGADR